VTPERKAEIIQCLLQIAASFEPTEEEPELTMFGLISRYNRQHPNPELIGGDWVIQNVPELKNLPI